MTITEKRLTTYALRFDHGYWADITLDEGEQKGRVSISSDWGTWSYYWGSCGCSFKNFLCGLDVHYFAGKCGESNWKDIDATIKDYKCQVLEMRRIEDITEQEARNVYDELKHLESFDSAAFIHEIKFKDTFMKLFEYPSIHTDVSPSFKAFFEKAWKPFVQHIRETEEVAFTNR